MANLKVKDNRLWQLFDESSKLFIITMLMERGFTGDVSLVVKIQDGVSYMEIESDCDIEFTLAIDILPLLND